MQHDFAMMQRLSVVVDQALEREDRGRQRNNEGHAQFEFTIEAKQPLFVYSRFRAGLVDAAGHRQRRRIGAETPNRGFPHLLRRRVEDQLAIDFADQPR